MQDRLQGKWVIVTGTISGIGKLTDEIFYKIGMPSHHNESSERTTPKVIINDGASR